MEVENKYTVQEKESSLILVPQPYELVSCSGNKESRA